MLELEYNFFFSSRRRHTRLTCDWSSDVCSSDLLAVLETRGDLNRAARKQRLEELLEELHISHIRDGLRSEEHTSELQSHVNLVCRLLLEKKKNSSHHIQCLTQQRIQHPSHGTHS